MVVVVVVVVVIIIIIIVIVVVVRRNPWFSNQGVPGVGTDSLTNT